jgi:hypothetical protein
MTRAIQVAVRGGRGGLSLCPAHTHTHTTSSSSSVLQWRATIADRSRETHVRATVCRVRDVARRRVRVASRRSALRDRALWCAAVRSRSRSLPFIWFNSRYRIIHAHSQGALTFTSAQRCITFSTNQPTNTQLPPILHNSNIISKQQTSESTQHPALFESTTTTTTTTHTTQ